MSHVMTEIKVPAGVPVHSMDGSGWTTSRRARTILRAEVSTYGDWIVTTWPGAGGYWRRTVQWKGNYVGHWPSDEAEMGSEE